MKRYVIFLRGVTPTGRNRVPMTPLREALAAAGLVDVRTYIQSGNVLARTDLPASQVDILVHDIIAKQFGGDLAVLTRTPAQVRRIFGGTPFRGVDTSTLFFTILARKPAGAQVRHLAGLEFPPDRFVVTGAVVYVHCPTGYGTSKLSNNFFERRLRVPATTRNYNTMRNLLRLSAEME